MKKLREKISILIAKKPAMMVLVVILLFNIVFFLAASGIISALSLQGTENLNFIEAAFYTLTMILDPGCISFVVTDIGTAGVVISIVCLCVVVVGMISFTGSVIGYVTNYISSFIERANDGARKLVISDHIVILNWNSRASEIINDLLYSDRKEKVVVLVSGDKEAVSREIDERIADTVEREVRAGNKFKSKITVIVREGDVYSIKQLQDLAINKARSVIILGADNGKDMCEFAKENARDNSRGNSQTVKILMQVADMVSAADSADNQKIIVEIGDEWTYALVNKIIKYKTVAGKCNIFPVRVNKTLGQILSQFSLMPELNVVYRELFSNKGSAFYTLPTAETNEIEFIEKYLKNHNHAIPLTVMKTNEGLRAYYSTVCENDIAKQSAVKSSDYSVELNPSYCIEKKTVIVLGHNSKSRDIMQGFASFCGEWSRDGVLPVEIVVIDGKNSLEKMNYYKEYPFIKETVCADIYDRELVCETIENYVNQNENDTSVLILSDDNAPAEEIDSSALANLVYVQDIINRKLESDPSFDIGKLDIVVEIINPKHHDIVNSYSVKNVVISNRYVSKMMAQICEKEALYDFYRDILTYDDEEAGEQKSKEVYIKKVSHYFAKTPDKCTVGEFIRAVFTASIALEPDNPSVAIGYVKGDGSVIIFEGNQDDQTLQLSPQDKIILFAEH